MSHFDDLSPEERIKLARDAVKFRIPISPRIALWLQEEGLYDQVTNPKKVTPHEEDQETDQASDESVQG